MKLAKKIFEIGQKAKKLHDFEVLWDLDIFAAATTQREKLFLSIHRRKFFFINSSEKSSVDTHIYVYAKWKKSK